MTLSPCHLVTLSPCPPLSLVPLSQLTAEPLFGLTLTLTAYALALAIHHKFRFLHPLLVTCLLVMAFLLVARVPIDDYQTGGKFLEFFLGPATVALAVPLYRHAAVLRRHAVQIALTILTGSLIGIFSAAVIALLFHATRDVILSVLAKCCTTPIAIEVTRELHGNESLAASIVVLSGLTGALLGPPLLRLLHIRKHSAIGLAIGAASHGIGTSSLLRHNELQGTYAGLAMALNGILTAALLTPAAHLIQKLL
ncbi:MAG: LrgB family protein [Phycisphaerales bacterium]|nr:LrgB family protein [Phycisphaerales bacterium]